MPDIKPQKVAIVHDWLVGGGAERVVFELHRLFPDAPIYTSYCTDEWRRRLDDRVVTGWLQRFGFMRKFMTIGRIWWFTHLDLSAYDLVISSCGNGEAKSVRLPKNVKHICYCHAPTHYYWRHYEQYRAVPGFGALDPLARLGLTLLIKPLRRWDFKAAQRPDMYIANSSHTAAEIKKFYGRDSAVIFPPVDTERFVYTGGQKRRGFVTAGRQTPYKKTNIIIEACNRLSLPLTVIGRGPEHDKLVKLAGPTIRFETSVSDAQMPRHLTEASGFIFAAYEDFGVTPVEAMACGTPVIAYRQGGAADYVVPGLSGEFFANQTVDSLCEALQKFEPTKYDPSKIRQHAQKFSAENFRRQINRTVNDFMNPLPVPTPALSTSGTRQK